MAAVTARASLEFADMRESRLSLGQLFLIAAIASIVVLSLSLDATIPWHPWSTFGFGVDSNGTVTAVDPAYPAAKAGIRPGDRIDLQATPADDRRWLVGQLAGVTLEPNTVARLTIQRDGALRPVVIASQLRPRSIADNLSLLLSTLGAFVFLAVCIALVVIRPSGITWAFFFVGAGTTAWGATLLPALLPVPARYWYVAFVDVLAVGATFGFLAFALLFTHEPVRGWRQSALRIIPFAFVLVAAASVYAALAPGALGIGAETTSRLSQSVQVALYALGSVMLLDSYVKSRGLDRQRIKWVIAGLVVGFGGIVADQIITDTSWFRYNPQPWLLNVLDSLPVLCAFAVAYAVIKHRVIDIRFVISRALVYGLLTSLLVAVFALIDWLLGRVFEQTKLALVGEIAAAIAAGFWINGLHRTVDRAIDSLLFRQRHLAERRLERVAAGLPHAATRMAVNDFIVAEPVDALSLTSGALFRRNERNVFQRVAAIGWPELAIATLNDPSAILVPLQGELGPIRIDETRWRATDLPHGEARPVLALPIIVRHAIEAIAFYGIHKSGEDLDPDEVKAISLIARAASAAYDRLEADELRAEIAVLKAQRTEDLIPQPG